VALAGEACGASPFGVVSVAAGVEVEGAAVVGALEGERSRADVPVERIDTVGDMSIDPRSGSSARSQAATPR
jgi:hypothetical protein